MGYRSKGLGFKLLLEPFGVEGSRLFLWIQSLGFRGLGLRLLLKLILVPYTEP